MASEGLPVVDFDEVGPAVGQRFPDIRLPDQSGASVDLHDERGDRPAIVVFYRSADW